jgi:hypothetical protein
MVYDTGSGRQVVYLMKYTDEFKQKLEQAKTVNEKMQLHMQYVGSESPELVKKPGEGDWVGKNSDAGKEIRKLPPGAKAVGPDPRRR